MTLSVVSSNEDAQQQHQSSTKDSATMEAPTSSSSTSTEQQHKMVVASQDSGFGSQPSPSYLGHNLRITACANQGGRKYMEDRVHVHVARTPLGAIDWTYVAVYDGHGGPEASEYCRQHLLRNIQAEKDFNSEDDDEFLEAIRSGFLKTHHTMWKEVDNWERTASGYPSTAGTTASCAFIRRGKVYVGHVGDSAILLTSRSNPRRYVRLTEDHKPESFEERKRIEAAGGSVMQKAHVHRVVWTRAAAGYVGPLRRNTPTQTIPFLAVARSLGDFWSYIEETQEFSVSPNPDVAVHVLTPDHHALVLASDGLTNVMSATLEAAICQELAAEEKQKRWFTNPNEHPNTARILMRRTMLNWRSFRADNVSVLAVLFDDDSSSSSSPSSSDEAVVDSSSDLPVEIPKKTCVDTELSEHPLDMIHVTNEKVMRYQTAPVSLNYRGIRDNDFCPVESVGPGFVSHDTERVCAASDDDDIDSFASNHSELEAIRGRMERLQQYYDMLGVGSRDVTPENQPPATSTRNLTNVTAIAAATATTAATAPAANVGVIGEERKAKFTSAAARLIDELRRDGEATAAAAAANAASVAAADACTATEGGEAVGDARPVTPENRPDAGFAVLRSSRSSGKRKSRIFEAEDDNEDESATKPSTSASSSASGEEEEGDDEVDAADVTMEEEEEKSEHEGTPEHEAVLKMSLPFADDDDEEEAETAAAPVAGDGLEAVRQSLLRTPSPIGDDADSEQVVGGTPICNSAATEREMVRRVTRSAAATSSSGSKKEMVVVDRPATRRTSARRLPADAAAATPATPLVLCSSSASILLRTPKPVLEVDDTCISISSRTRSRANEVTPPGSVARSTSASGSRKRPRTATMDTTMTTPLLAKISLADENADSDEAKPLKAGTSIKWKRANRQPFGSSDQVESTRSPSEV